MMSARSERKHPKGKVVSTIRNVQANLTERTSVHSDRLGHHFYQNETTNNKETMWDWSENGSLFGLAKATLRCHSPELYFLF